MSYGSPKSSSPSEPTTQCCEYPNNVFSDTLRLVVPYPEMPCTNYGGAYDGCCDDCTDIHGTYDFDFHSRTVKGDTITWEWRGGEFNFCGGDDVYTGMWQIKIFETETSCEIWVYLKNPNYIESEPYPLNQDWLGCDDPTLPYWYSVTPVSESFCEGTAIAVPSGSGHTLCQPDGYYLGTVQQL
jgi:hypothetical protein